MRDDQKNPIKMTSEKANEILIERAESTLLNFSETMKLLDNVLISKEN